MLKTTRRRLKFCNSSVPTFPTVIKCLSVPCRCCLHYPAPGYSPLVRSTEPCSILRPYALEVEIFVIDAATNQSLPIPKSSAADPTDELYTYDQFDWDTKNALQRQADALQVLDDAHQEGFPTQNIRYNQFDCHLALDRWLRIYYFSICGPTSGAWRRCIAPSHQPHHSSVETSLRRLLTVCCALVLHNASDGMQYVQSE